MKRATLFLAVGLLAGCSAEVPIPRPVASVAPDTSVAIVGADEAVIDTIERYIAITNDILRGGDVAAMSSVATPRWVAEEEEGFAALEALGGDAPEAVLTALEVTSIRGVTVVVDAIASACIAGSGSVQRVSVYLIPREGSLVIDDIVPWEDSTWCADLPSL